MSSALPSCLGYAETQFLSVTAMIADAMIKSADVSLLGLEPNGSEGVCIRIGAETPADLDTALEHAKALAAQLGSSAHCVSMAAPHFALRELNKGPMIINGLYGGREELRPTDFQTNSKTMMKKIDALGILETVGLTASLVATDTMLKAANVELAGKEKIGAAYVTIMIRGNLAAVEAAVEAGRQAAGAHGKVVAAHTIARPHDDLAALLP